MSEQLATCSVIIPTHNRGELTVRAVSSVLSNVPADGLEVIIVDDASTDGSTQALSAEYTKNSRVRLLSLRRNSGPSAARNAGLAAAGSDLILFLDSDDRLLPRALAFARAALRAVPKIRFVALDGDCITTFTGRCDRHAHLGNNLGWMADVFRESVKWTVQVNPPEDMDERPCKLVIGDFSETELYDDLFFLSGVVMHRRAALAAGGFNERLWWGEDWDFMARLNLTGMGGYLDHVGFVRETGRPDQLTRVGGSLRLAVTRQRILENLRASRFFGDGPSRALLRRAQAAADYRLGRCLLDRRHVRPGRRYLLRGLRAGHKPLKTLVLLAGGKPVSALERRRNRFHDRSTQQGANAPGSSKR
ncbi:MAG: glycosyltransferase family 2 protein [Gammaproteobacteria bacterium]|nr:glycosyltransferase family 2 protein [Gammaproteobacteria bacterium]